MKLNYTMKPNGMYILSGRDFDDIATLVLTEYMPKVLEWPQPVNIDYLATECLPIDIRHAKYGKTVCPGCRIHEDMLYELTASVAPINEIEKMSAADNTLTFHLKNGSVEKREWRLRSRAESWTPEMKETARQAATKQRRDHKCRE